MLLFLVTYTKAVLTAIMELQKRNVGEEKPQLSICRKPQNVEYLQGCCR